MKFETGGLKSSGVLTHATCVLGGSWYECPGRTQHTAQRLPGGAAMTGELSVLSDGFTATVGLSIFYRRSVRWIWSAPQTQ